MSLWVMVIDSLFVHLGEFFPGPKTAAKGGPIREIILAEWDLELVVQSFRDLIPSG